MQCKTILIIEDDEANREMLKSVLELEGYAIITAANGQEGIAALNLPTPPSLILLDMMMPVMSGWAFLDTFRSNPNTCNIPVIVVSAYIETAKTVKSQGFVPKPIQLQDLLSVISKCAA